MRLMLFLPLPDVGENFSAYPTLSGLPVSEETGGRRNDGDTESTEDAGQARRLRVDAEAGLGDAADAGDAALAVRAVLQVERQHAAGLPLRGVGNVEARDVA